MANQKQTKGGQGSQMVQPGERALLFSHRQYREVREQGQGLENYDLLMRGPEDPEASEKETPESERWLPVRADKYLKHRANGWREVGSLEALPERHREQAETRNVLSSADAGSEGGE